MEDPDVQVRCWNRSKWPHSRGNEVGLFLKKKNQTFYTDVLSFLHLITYKNQKRDKKFSSQWGGVSA